MDYLKNKSSETHMVENITIATRQLAKRQMTWMRKMENLEIFEPFNHDLNLKVKYLFSSKINDLSIGWEN